MTIKQFYLSCPKGIENALIRDLSHFFEKEMMEKTNGGVRLKAEQKDLLKSLPLLRIPSRVYLELDTFKFKKEKDIFHRLRKFPWGDWVQIDQTFKINTSFDRASAESFNNSMYLSLLAKDALADTMRELHDERPNVDTKNPHCHFFSRIEKITDNKGPHTLFNYTLYIDLTGTPLCHRGYRERGHSAPLRENLAAALIDELNWNFDEPFIDVMCGSGTVLIEALLFKNKIAPSYLRLNNFFERGFTPFAFMELMPFKKDKELIEEIENHYGEIVDKVQQTLNNLPIQNIFGNDSDGRSKSMMTNTLQKFGLDRNIIAINNGEFKDFEPPKTGPGVIFCNPPYGERMGELDDLKEMYYNLGEYFKAHCQNFSCFIFTGNIELRKAISLKTSSRKEFKNGKIDCRLLQYNIY